ncbi:hypothetical protein LINPERHAP2_LOCUS587 [Linum perenne]
MEKNTHGGGPSNSHHASLEDEMLLRWAEEDRQMRAKSLDEEDTDKVDEEDDDDDEEDEEIVYEDPPPLNEEPRNDTSVPPVHESLGTDWTGKCRGMKEVVVSRLQTCVQHYFDYATREGFAIKIHYRSRAGRKGDNSEKLIYVTLACRRQGYKKGSLLKPKVQIGEAVMDPEPQVQPQRVHNEKRIGCLAKIHFRMNETTGSRHVDDAIWHMASINKEAGIGLRSSYEILCKNARGRSSLVLSAAGGRGLSLVLSAAGGRGLSLVLSATGGRGLSLVLLAAIDGWRGAWCSRRLSAAIGYCRRRTPTTPTAMHDLNLGTKSRSEPYLN